MIRQIRINLNMSVCLRIQYTRKLFMPTQKTVLFYKKRNSTSMEQIACVLADVLCPISFVAGGKVRQPSHLLPGLGAWVLYSPGANVNTPFFQAHPR